MVRLLNAPALHAVQAAVVNASATELYAPAAHAVHVSFAPRVLYVPAVQPPLTVSVGEAVLVAVAEEVGGYVFVTDTSVDAAKV